MVFDKKKWQKEYDKIYKKKNQEKIKIYRIENKEKSNEYMKNYNKSKNGRKSDWKRKGVNLHNFEEFYKIYIETTNCDICDTILTDGNPMKSSTKCLDHDHKTGEFRCILCSSCNIRRR